MDRAPDLTDILIIPPIEDSALSSVPLADIGSFLSHVVVHDMQNGQLLTTDYPIDACTERVREDGLPHVVEEGDRVVLAIPVFCGAELRSIVTLVGKSRAGASGVFEIWEPHGPYRDLRLTEGYFGRLERFQNVSSFVRFEIGSGLPGQAAMLGQAIIHDDLQNHPGFLRAAGASAGELQTAIALPIFNPNFAAAVLLISSRSTPLARCVEVWTPVGTEFELQQIAHTELLVSFGAWPEVGKRLSAATGIFGEVVQHRNAILCNDPCWLAEGHVDLEATASESCLAIPTYQDATLKSITLLWL